MSNFEDEFEYADYDLEDAQDALVVPATEALPYPDTEVQETEDSGPIKRTFVNPMGVTPREAIATARKWSLARKWVGGAGLCLMTVRQYYGVGAGVPTAAASWAMSDHKRRVASGVDCPRGTPVYWTGGSHGAGHIAISTGGGNCFSTDWKEAGRIDRARIDDITSHWGLNFQGYSFEVNGVQVWKPAGPIGTVHLSNLKPGKRNKDVLLLKKRLHTKGYRGFILGSDKFGFGLKRAYAKYQRSLGYSGKAANGVPGAISLKKLGFKVL